MSDTIAVWAHTVQAVPCPSSIGVTTDDNDDGAADYIKFLSGGKAPLK